MQDSALDFITFIIVLGIVVAISFNLVIPIVKDSQQLIHQEQYDKTIQKAQGDIADTNVDGTYSIEEIVLQVMGQSYFMPYPRVIDLGGTRLIIEADQGFSPITKGIGMQAYEAVETWANDYRAKGIASVNNKLLTYGLEAVDYSLPAVKDMRFKLQFDYGDTEDETDDSYALHISINCRDLGTGVEEQVLFKCLPSGNIVKR